MTIDDDVPPVIRKMRELAEYEAIAPEVRARITIEIAIGTALDAIAARLGVPSRTEIMAMTGEPMESDSAYRQRILHRAGLAPKIRPGETAERVNTK